MDELNKCSRKCWIVGAIVGLVVLVLLLGPADYKFIWALIWAVIAGLLAAYLLQYFFCQTTADVVEPQTRSPDVSLDPPRTQTSQPAVSPKPAVDPSASAQPEPAAEQESAQTAPSKSPEVDKGGGDPATLTAPRGDVADDLKRIKGVGPKLESSLNALGIFHFDQIAAWSDSDIDWAEENLGGTLKRVHRDDWVAQARILTDGGETKFSKKVDKGNYY